MEDQGPPYPLPKSLYSSIVIFFLAINVLLVSLFAQSFPDFNLIEKVNFFAALLGGSGFQLILTGKFGFDSQSIATPSMAFILASGFLLYKGFKKTKSSRYYLLAYLVLVAPTLYILVNLFLLAGSLSQAGL